MNEIHWISVCVYIYIYTFNYVDFQCTIFLFLFAFVFVSIFHSNRAPLVCWLPSLSNVPWGNDKCHSLYNVPRLLTRSIERIRNRIHIRTDSMCLRAQFMFYVFVFFSLSLHLSHPFCIFIEKKWYVYMCSSTTLWFGKREKIISGEKKCASSKTLNNEYKYYTKYKAHTDFFLFFIWNCLVQAQIHFVHWRLTVTRDAHIQWTKSIYMFPMCIHDIQFNRCLVRLNVLSIVFLCLFVCMFYFQNKKK